MADEEKEDELAAGPLTEIELRSIRRMLRDESHARWLWATFRRWVGYGSAAVGALYVSWDYIVKIVSALLHVKGAP